jgi:hypothetical protein
VVARVRRAPTVYAAATEAFVGKKMLRIHSKDLSRDCWLGKVVRGSLTGGMADDMKKNAAAVALGRLGGLKGGKARARNMTPEQRAESARKAAVARWSKKKG